MHLRTCVCVVVFHLYKLLYTTTYALQSVDLINLKV